MYFKTITLHTFLVAFALTERFTFQTTLFERA